MTLFSELRHRQRLPELMDDPTLEASRHRDALSGLTRLNRWSFTANAIWSRLMPVLRQCPGRLRLLDVATGAGDIPIALWKIAQRHGFEIELQGCDVSSRAVEFARERATRADTPVNFFTHDVLAHELPDKWDVVVCSLFMHHLVEADAVTLLGRMQVAARQLALVSDLVRKRSSYWMAQVACHVLTRSDVVRTDGPLSVRAAFTCNEAFALAEQAGWKPCSISRQWPCRFLLEWRSADRAA